MIESIWIQITSIYIMHILCTSKSPCPRLYSNYSKIRHAMTILATRAFTGKKGSGKIAFYIEVTYVGIVHFQGWTRTEKFKSKRELRNLNTVIYTDVQLRTPFVEGPQAEFEVRWGGQGPIDWKGPFEWFQERHQKVPKYFQLTC